MFLLTRKFNLQISQLSRSLLLIVEGLDKMERLGRDESTEYLGQERDCSQASGGWLDVFPLFFRKP